MEKRNLVSPGMVFIHVGTNDLKTTRNLDFVMGEVYAFGVYSKEEAPNCRFVLNGVLRHRDVSWWRIGTLNDRFDWVANAVGLKFIDLNSLIEDGDFGRDGLNLNGRGKR